MKTIQQNILHRTGLTKSDYTMLCFENFKDCIAELSRNPHHLQRLLLCKKINKWYAIEVQKLNKEFIEVTIPYLPLKKIDVANAYKNYLKRIARNYPSVLVKQVEYRELESSILNLN